jgi:hypothetical protein
MRSNNKGAFAMKRFHPVYLFLLVPYAVWVWVPFYNRIEPRLLDIPFFYWWQIAGIFITALCILPVYLHQESRRK